MKVTHFDQLPAHEQDAFIRACARRQRGSFEFRVHAEDPKVAAGEAPVRRRIFVQQVSTWYGKHYPAEPGSNWTSAFERDLQMGTFI